MSKNNNNTPRLRFPGFTGEWEERLVKDICNINTGKSNTQDQVEDGLYPFYIRSATPVRSNRYLYDCEAVITIGDGQIGKVFHYVNGKFDLHQRCYMMSNFKDVACRYFYYFFSNNFYNRAIRLSAKGTVDSVRLEMISDMPIFLPPTLEEQQKIAECLMAIDDQISAQSQKVEALKDQKKGMMQELFPQKGETTPRLRFPEFTGDWEEKKLFEVATSFSGGTPKSGDPTYYGGNIPFIRSGEIHDNKTALFLTEKGLNNSSAKLVNKGDLLYALYGATSGEVGIARIDGAINQAILCIRSEEIDTCFLCGYLEHMKGAITSKYLQGGQGNLSGDIIMSINIPHPSPAEQQKIADCLSELDALIAAETEQLVALKDHKKGLMQQLFPQPAK